MEIGHAEQSLTAKLIWLVSTPIIFIVGVAGNSIAIAVFIKPKNNTSSTSVYFIWLAFADTLALVSEIPRWWLIYGIHYDVRHYSDIACKLWMFATVYATTLSSYVLLALTFERLLSTVKPHSVKTICTPRNANIVGGCFIPLVIICSVPMMYGWGLTYLPPDERSGPLTSDIRLLQCQNHSVGLTFDCNSTDMATSLSNANASADLTNSSNVLVTWTNTTEPSWRAGPSVTSHRVVCTWYRGDKYKLVQQLDGLVQFFVGFVFVELAMIVADVIIIYKLVTSGMNRKSNSKGKQTGHIRQITITLVSVNIVFIVCRTPVYIFLSFVNTTDQNSKPESQEIFWAVVNAFFFANHAANFFLYVLIGKRFRKQVMEMVCRQKHGCVQERTNTTSVNTVAGTHNVNNHCAKET